MTNINPALTNYIIQDERTGVSIIIPKLLRIKEVQLYTCMSCSAIYDIMNKKSPRYDATFPKKVKIGGKTLWVATEIAEWINNKITNR